MSPQSEKALKSSPEAAPVPASLPSKGGEADEGRGSFFREAFEPDYESDVHCDVEGERMSFGAYSSRSASRSRNSRASSLRSRGSFRGSMRQFLLDECADGADVDGMEARPSFGSRHTFGADEDRVSLCSCASLGERVSLGERSAPEEGPRIGRPPLLPRPELSFEEEDSDMSGRVNVELRLTPVRSNARRVSGLRPSRSAEAAVDDSCAVGTDHPSIPPLLRSREGLAR